MSRLLPPRAPLPPSSTPAAAELQASLHRMERCVAECAKGEEAPLVIYVSKMVAVPANALPR
jgi:ribosome assembly protein 1